MAAENKLLGDLFREHISSQLPIDLTGFSSDGDARRTANQKQNMTGEIASANAFCLGHAGFALHGRVTDGGSITDIEGQESKHVTKCTIGALAGKRNLQLGEYMACLNHVKTAWDEYGSSAMQMDKAAKDRDDRQNYLAAAMVTCLGASCHLKKMQKAGWGSGSKPAVETQGTDAYRPRP